MARTRTVLATCPICKGTLEINAANGKVLRSFEFKQKSEGEDQLQDSLKEVKERSSKVEAKFKASQEKEKTKLHRIEKAFLEKKKEIDESGDTSKPIRDIDLD